jgi:hypothetical protein
MTTNIVLFPNKKQNKLTQLEILVVDYVENLNSNVNGELTKSIAALINYYAQHLI